MSDPVIAAAPEGVLTTDDAGSILAANSKAEQLFESRAWELVGRPLTDLLSPSFQQLLGARGNWVEVTATRLDGTEFPAEVALSQLEELPVRYAVWIRDLPRSARRESPIRRAALFDATEIVGGVGGWEFTPSENTLRWSDNLYRLFGYEPGEIIPSPQIVYAATHPDDRERVERHVEEVTEGRAEMPFDYRIVVPGLGIRHLRTRLAILEEHQGRPWRMIGSVQDITEERRAEREIAAHVAVSDALAEWRSLEHGGPLLLRSLAEAIDFFVGILWVPVAETLVMREFWCSRTVDLQFKPATREPRMKPGIGLPGVVWKTKEPAVIADASEEPSFLRREWARRAGLRGAIAFPALHREEVLAVLELFSAEKAAPPERLMRSLTGIGYEIGRFLATRRGELQPPSLTAREREVLQLAAQGMSAPQVAKELVVTRATIKTHFANIYAKLEVPDRASAVAKALRLGLIE